MIVPEHLQIETINGTCTARCTMCSYKAWKRRPHTMDSATFRAILERFLPYLDQLRYLSLQSFGEPLLDKGLAEKVRIAKDMGFRGIGFATNCTELDKQKSEALMKAGLDTILCGIDGTRKETHEAIRIGTDFDRIVSNVKGFVRLRKELGARTRVVIRFIRQEINKEEWPGFLDYWSKQLSADLGDEVVKFDIHNCAGSVVDYESQDPNSAIELGNVCDELWTRLVVFSNGGIQFCNADINGFFDFGNVVDSDPMEIFNNETFTRYRKMMKEGRIRELEHCRDCTIPRSRALKEEG